jgi:hypothetical protein
VAEPAAARTLGAALVALGLLVVLAGLLLLLLDRVPGFGRLPGDLVLRRGRVTLWIPLASMLLVSLLLTLLLNLFRRR